MGRRVALLIATDEHLDAGLRRLTAPAADAQALAAVLRDPGIAGFDVTVLVNEPHYRVGEAIGDFYRDRRRDDLTLLYFTGHGLKDDDGRLYLAMSNTRRDSLLFTALPAEQIDYAMQGCVCRQKILVLDCCYSGAFPAGRAVKADTQVHALEQFHGRGRTVLTASDATQYSFEGDRLTGAATQSVFTRYLVEGLRGGGADLDGDGDITLDELYTYVHDRVVEEMPRQRPKKQTDVEGRTVIARNVNWALPGYLRNALNSPIATDRLGALEGLLHLHRIGNDHVRTQVATEIERLAHDDSRTVSAAAATHLQTIRPPDLRPAALHEPPPTAAPANRPPAEPTPPAVSPTESSPTAVEPTAPPVPTRPAPEPRLPRDRGRQGPPRLELPALGPNSETTSAAHEQPDPTNAAADPETARKRPSSDIEVPETDRSLATPGRPDDYTAAVMRRWRGGWRGQVVAAVAVLAAFALLFTAITTFKPAGLGQTITSDTGVVYAVATAQLGGRPVVICGSGNTVQVWDLATGDPVGEPLTDRAGVVFAVTSAQLDGQPVIISGAYNTVRVWDPATDVPVGEPLTGHTASVYAVATAQLDGRPVIISGSIDEMMRVWDLATGAPIRAVAGHTGSVFAVATAQLDGQPVIISGSADKTVRVSDLATGAPIRTLTGHTGSVTAVASAQLNGRPVIIAGSDDFTVRVWDLATGAPVGRAITGHTGAVGAVASAQLDGRPVIVSGSDDSTVRVWDLATGAPVGQPLTGHTGPVNAVTTAQLGDRTILITGSDDATIRTRDLAASVNS